MDIETKTKIQRLHNKVLEHSEKAKTAITPTLARVQKALMQVYLDDLSRLGVTALDGGDKIVGS